MATKSSKREKNRGKRPQSNLILEQITEKLKNIQSQKNEGKHHPGSTIAHMKYRAKNVDGKWRFVVKVPNHNHHASPTEEHMMHQCLDETPFESIIALTQAGARPHTVLSSLLQQDLDTAASSKNISNAKTKRRTEYLSGQSPIQALKLTGNIV